MENGGEYRVDGGGKKGRVEDGRERIESGSFRVEGRVEGVRRKG